MQSRPTNFSVSDNATLVFPGKFKRSGPSPFCCQFYEYCSDDVGGNNDSDRHTKISEMAIVVEANCLEQVREYIRIVQTYHANWNEQEQQKLPKPFENSFAAIRL